MQLKIGISFTFSYIQTILWFNYIVRYDTINTMEMSKRGWHQWNTKKLTIMSTNGYKIV